MIKINPEQLVYFYIVNTNTIFSRTYDNFQCVVSNSDYISLSENQTTYYLSHPGASFDDIIDCYTPPPPQPFILEDYKSKKITELDTLSLNTAGRLSPAYQRENATVSLELINLIENGVETDQSPVYDKTQCLTIIAQANHCANLCRNERYRVFNLINDAQTKETVDIAFNSHTYNEM